MSVEAVLGEVRPQVEEWREIRTVVPVDALVSLSPTPPGHDVQIRSDQWQILTMVGTSGRSVNDVLDAIGGDQITGLRTLRDLTNAGLLQLTPASGRLVGDFGPPSFGPAPNGSANEATILPVPPVSADEATILPVPPVSADEATILPVPPVSADEAADVPVVPPPPVAEPVAVGAEDRSGSLAEVTVMPPPIADDPWAPVSEAGDPKDDGAA